MTTKSETFAATGRLWLRNAVARDDLAHLATLFPEQGKPGARVAADDPLFRSVTALPFQTQLQHLWPHMRPVRMVTFAKSDGANWGVPWHQDRIIAVQAKADAPGFTNWSRKGGTLHCEAPDTLLEKMLFVRLHLDASTVENGAMQIALGSHQNAIMPADQAAEAASSHPCEATIADPGDVLVMALMHKSDPATLSDGRRAIRIDYAPCDLPAPLRWATDQA